MDLTVTKTTTHEFVGRFQVAAYREPNKKPEDIDDAVWAAVFPNGAGYRYAEHWSTLTDGERLFTETDLRRAADKVLNVSAVRDEIARLIRIAMQKEMAHGELNRVTDRVETAYVTANKIMKLFDIQMEGQK
jgi:hypothetical protein